VLRSVGYQSVPLPGVPFDTTTMTVPNKAGRVSPRQYVAGWLKRGPTGVIGTNKSDAAETVRTLLADLADGSGTGGHDPARHDSAGHGGPVEEANVVGPDGPGPTRIDDVLASRGVHPISYEEWLGIEAAESALGATLGRGERVKLVGLSALLHASGHDST
jgi:ferredoxin--NADP+ reductase